VHHVAANCSFQARWRREPRSECRPPHSGGVAPQRGRIGSFSAARHTQHDDAGWIDPRLPCQPSEPSYGIGVRLGLRDPVLIVARSTHPARPKTVDDQRSDAVPCEDAGVVQLGMCRDAAARIDDDGSRNSALGPRAIEVGGDPVIVHPISLWPSRHDFDVARQPPRFLRDLDWLCSQRGGDQQCEAGNEKPRHDVSILTTEQDRNYERSHGIWTNLFGGSKKNSEENSEK
jgi:hypothetical protein